MRGAMRGAASWALLGALAGLSSACATSAYCFDCGGAGGAGGAGGEGGATTGGGGLNLGAQGGAGLGGASNCGGGVDVLTDENNCGFCGNVCQPLANAFVECQGGFCVIGSCSPGAIDLDAVIANGCEYACVESNAGVEICDELDNDCNGLVDELTSKDDDVLHCGGCDVVCGFTNAEPQCVGGQCLMGDCVVGYVDANDDPADGCEYLCVETNGGVEVCDYVDNDCDTLFDEGFDLTSDPDHCGACNNDCGALFPGSVPTCDASVCVLGPCLSNFFDYDGLEANGCEYFCLSSNGGVEQCDGVDNDCNGVIDDGTLPGVGDPCGASDVGACELGVQACEGGALTCVGEVVASLELCDGVDNDCGGDVDEACPVVGPSDQRLDLGGGSGVGQAVSTQLSASSQGDVVLAAWLDRRSGNADIRANLSQDGGLTWLASDLPVASAAQNEVEPFAFQSPTAAYVAFARFPTAEHRDVFVARAASPYASFAAPVRADQDATGADAFLVRGAVVQAGSPDALVVVWQSLSGTGANVTTDVYLQRSLDGGVTWLAQDLRVNAVAGTAELPSLATDGQGNAFIAWRDSRNAASEVYVDVYDATLGVLAGNQPISGGHPAQDIVITAAPGGPDVHVAFTDLRAPKRQIRVVSSPDGLSWPSDGLVVNPDSTFADASSPALACDASRVVVAWEDTRSGASDVRVNQSLDLGQTWLSATPRVDLGAVAGTSASTRPWVSLGAGDRVYVAWEDARFGQRDIFANHSFVPGALVFQPLDLRLDVGAPGAPSPAGAADSRAPFVFATLGGARATAVWLDNRTSSGADGVNADVYAHGFE